MATSTLTFWGGAQSVTGANFLLEDVETKARILFDCGLAQGKRMAEAENRDPFPYDPKSITALIVSHAHMDHVGRIPKLVRDGFQGTIYSTLPTKDVAAVMLEDSLGLLEKEARAEGREVLYTPKDVDRAMELWQGIEYHKHIDLPAGYRFFFKDAGHILGSAMAAVVRDKRTLIVTGDLGNTPALLMRDTESLEGAHYVVIESVYGDRNHEPRHVGERILREAITDVVANNGTLVVPAFSLERTQELLFQLNALIERGKFPRFPVFIDSPLAIKVTGIYKKHARYFNELARGLMHGGDDIFNFPNLHFTLSTEESRAIARTPNPKMIIAGSGMSNGGRILHHHKQYLPDDRSVVLLIGYQAAGTLGRQLEEGTKEVRIHGETIPVRAKVARILSYSSHKDSDRLVDLVAPASETIEQVFVTLGEPKSAFFLAQRLRDYAPVHATVPEKGQMFTLNL